LNNVSSLFQTESVTKFKLQCSGELEQTYLPCWGKN